MMAKATNPGPVLTQARRQLRRRAFLAFATGLWPAYALAVDSSKIPHIGYLSPGSPQLTPRDKAFFDGLRKLGYYDGDNIVIEYRFAGGHFDRLAHFAKELVSDRVAVIVTVVTDASLAARNATATIPIVMIAVSDPLNAGLIRSFARPEGNITGTSSMYTDVIGKSVELLEEAVPSMSRIGILWNPANSVYQTQMLGEATRAADTLKVTSVPAGATNSDELNSAFTSFANSGVSALLVLTDPLFVVLKSLLLDLTKRSRLPAMFGPVDFAEAGGLMAYGPDMESQFRAAASYVDRILKGARPEDLPVERPRTFNLALNLKTAKAIGITFPLSLLGQADEVFE